MRSSLFLAVWAAAVVSGLSIDNRHQQQVALENPSPAPDQYLIELSPGEVRWVTEEEKWELKRNDIKFMDITDNGHTYPLQTASSSVTYPSKPKYNETVRSLAKGLNKDNMRKHLEGLTSFHTRYYKSEYGIRAAEWLYGQIDKVISAAGAFDHGASLNKFAHPWGQFSIIARFPGRTNHTIVIGAHLDSINLFLPAIFAAPGADDDGSGTVTILEALTALLQSEDIVHGKAENTVEFHWYSAEEGGLLGSQAIFKSYSEAQKEVKAMIQQDMTGYIEQTLAHGKPESVGVITDFVNPDLTEFIKQIITTYCDIPYTLTKCGYACSDHASASKYGYPSAFVIESDFEYSDKKIHTTEDLIKYLSFDHMLQHAKMTLGFAYEAAFAPF
ncbi:Leucine aminopeptidase 1 [Exophiala dermatitidis]|uniref:Peptide hydrolase n=2 Tax=Exophiala dermatitidis TaxID=5970 RepID=H6CA34_EXODN|nr:leucyl aminopeptidase [Exophiala dermatitidis NIH/UT8656]KAJ4507373.1 Leucine aminopeptidase 1 [Exophiala dermatitidis]EHY59998.1 leucyl aminopeptidase [Exophiala dermatitidis NIH/UT8656]KAJ4509363.1 Leucine aminopeptidase 1 [Exophiala dermatitidis]KAJ4509550.1 Leucine aminopeptidase 1 [Exophiala dermatitidis]KAJ4530551.1 Leucine aminopeptidase 1 [Exophiala dermatitidis]